MTIKNLVLCSFLFASVALFSQEANPPFSKKEFDENYQKRIELATLDGQYIPKDLPDALSELNKLTDEPSRNKFKNMSENDAVHKLYFSLGRWMTTNWGFYEGSRLSHYLKEVNITFPEDQATALIIAWHRSLNKKDINFREIRDKLVEKRKKEKEERLRGGTIIKEEVRKTTPSNEIKN